jgi:hypothetical protein
MRSFRAAISRKIKNWSFCDYGPLSGAVEIAHRRTNADIEQLLSDILQRVHNYTMKTAYCHRGLNFTTITVNQLSEVAGPIPNEFLTTK